MGITMGVKRSLQQNRNGRATLFGTRRRSWAEFGERVARLAGFQLPTISAPTAAPSAMSVRRDSPRHMTVLPGGGSLARAR
jgi:hypothetical protein